MVGLRRASSWQPASWLPRLSPACSARTLPCRSPAPAQLIDELQTPHVGGYSGTIDAQVDLGLPPRLSAALAVAAPAGALLRGSHRLRYWYGDADHQRVAVVSRHQRAGHVPQRDAGVAVGHRAPASPGTARCADNADAALPRGASVGRCPRPAAAGRPARRTSLGTSSDMALRSGDPVAGRPTYELVLDAGHRGVADRRDRHRGRRAAGRAAARADLPARRRPGRRWTSRSRTTSPSAHPTAGTSSSPRRPTPQVRTGDAVGSYSARARRGRAGRHRLADGGLVPVRPGHRPESGPHRAAPCSAQPAHQVKGKWGRDGCWSRRS